MSIDVKSILSDNALNMRRSAIRDLLSVAVRPDIISFAGGFPNPDSFPVDDVKEIVQEIMEESPTVALQYGTTEGYAPLKREILKRYNAEGMPGDMDNLIITTSSQQAIDLICRVFINPGDVVICGLPSYLGALQAFYSYRADPIGVKDEEDPEVVIEKLIAEGRKPKFIYAIPDFQNPSGVTMGIKERQAILDLAKKYEIFILEDSPYKEIRFEGEHMPTMYSMDPERVILLGTFSKTFAPGFRLGWILGRKDVIERVVVAKQSSDLCTPVFCQMIGAKYLEKNYFEKNIVHIKEMYKRKKELMIHAFEQFMPEGVTWTNPEGGLFLFLKMPEGYCSRELFDLAIQENVAFVTGDSFFCDGSGQNTMRLNFSFASDEKIVEGVKRLALAIRKMMDEKSK